MEHDPTTSEPNWPPRIVWPTETRRERLIRWVTIGPRWFAVSMLWATYRWYWSTLAAILVTLALLTWTR